MNKSKIIRWGIIGCGDVTEVKSGPAFQKVANSQLIAVMRRDASKAKDYAKRHQVGRWYSDADQLIHDPEIDAVYIAAPPDSHKYYTLKVAEVGKIVYVEKPMARCYHECEQMIAACKKNNVPLFTAFYRRSRSLLQYRPVARRQLRGGSPPSFPGPVLLLLLLWYPG